MAGRLPRRSRARPRTRPSFSSPVGDSAYGVKGNCRITSIACSASRPGCRRCAQRSRSWSSTVPVRTESDITARCARLAPTQPPANATACVAASIPTQRHTHSPLTRIYIPRCPSRARPARLPRFGKPTWEGIMKSGAENTRALCGAALLLSVLTAPAALAVPSFARQTGMACEACPPVYPELAHFGRVFKANGYVLANLKQVRDVTAKKEQLLELAQTPPLSIMVQASYSQLTTTVPDLSQSAPGVAQNGSAGFPQQLR